MKKLYFAPPFPQELFNGEKFKTFRLNPLDEYCEGDLISFCYPDDIEFAQARVKKVLGNKRFGDFINEDWRGYEKFSSEEERNRIYSNWNRIEVNDDTLMGILIYEDFRLTGEIRKN